MSSATTSLPGNAAALPWYSRIVGARTQKELREATFGYVFLIPWLLGLIIFVVGPIIACLYFSFTNFEGVGTPQFVGLANYVKAFTGDDLFWPSLLRTFEYAVLVVPIGLLGSLVLAVMLNRAVKGISFFRTFFFIPTLTPPVALAILWVWLFHPSVGPINLALKWVGIVGPDWLQSPQWALPAIIIINLWGSVGGNTMIIFLAGLQGVPQEMMEAAEIDGAGRWAKFRHITLPMISPTFLFNLILGIIGALKVFTTAFVATQGGPQYATWFFALHIYQQAFSYFRMGYGSALSWLFVVVLIAFTYFQLVLSRRWVYYGGEG